ncbi:MAG: hypothetical protein A4E28_00155 [Methanocella sp. PtaU1.Bin125]|nr:MAG: hypothetical protein A4E28_00155 [Methanocella sp. PtaU1.Bin125]
MANKPAGKKTAKEIKQEKNNRLMIILLAIFLVGTMVLVPLAVLFNPSPIQGGSTDTDKDKFNSIVDALYAVPQGVEYMRFVNLTASERISNWTMTNLGGSVADNAVFGQRPVKDAIAFYPFPTFGYFDVYQQWVSLADFGQDYDNKSYALSSVNGISMRMITNEYAFTTGKPVISGRKESVAAVKNFLTYGSSSQSGYTAYSDLFQQIAARNQTAKDAKFAIVGQTSTFGVGDRYYAGLTPLNDTMCDYKIVVHLNQSLNLTEQQRYAATWTAAAMQFGLDSFSPEFTDNYLIVEAKGSPEICLNDLVTNWPLFVRA